MPDMGMLPPLRASACFRAIVLRAADGLFGVREAGGSGMGFRVVVHCRCWLTLNTGGPDMGFGVDVSCCCGL